HAARLLGDGVRKKLERIAVRQAKYPGWLSPERSVEDAGRTIGWKRLELRRYWRLCWRIGRLNFSLISRLNAFRDAAVPAFDLFSVPGDGFHGLHRPACHLVIRPDLF